MGLQKNETSPSLSLCITADALMWHKFCGKFWYLDVSLCIDHKFHTCLESSYNEDFYLRAAATRDYGIGALPPDEAIYFFTVLVWNALQIAGARCRQNVTFYILKCT